MATWIFLNKQVVNFYHVLLIDQTFCVKMAENVKYSCNKMLDHPVMKYFKSLKNSLEQHSSNHRESSCRCKDFLDSIRISVSSIEHRHLQDLIWSTEECVATLKLCMVTIFPSSNESTPSDKLPEAEENLTNAFVICIANLTAANGRAVVKLCEHFGYLNLYNILKSCLITVAQKWCAVILSILLQDSLAKSFLNTIPIAEVMHELCKLYSEKESEYACFALFCLELLLCKHLNCQTMRDVWFYSTYVHQLLMLSVFQAVISSGKSQKRNILASHDSLEFLCDLYCCECESVLENNEKNLQNSNPNVFREICATILCASATMPHSDYVKDKAAKLMPVSVRFLKTLNLATFRPQEQACKGTATGKWMLTKLIPETAGIGLRCDLVQLMGNLVDEHKQNQDMLCSIGGLEEIFCSCRRDESNPLIQEAVIFALSCGLKRNPENVEHLKNKLANREDGRNSELMEKLGLKPDEFVQVPSQK